MTRFHFALRRGLVQTPLATRFPLEMLDRVGHIHLAAVHAGFIERSIKQGTGGPDKRLALQVLLIAGLFANEHQRRMLWTRPWDSLRGRLPQDAAAALIEVLRLLVRTNAYGPGRHNCINRQRRCALAPASRGSAWLPPAARQGLRGRMLPLRQRGHPSSDRR